MTVADIIKESKHLEKDFKQAGISLKLYDRPPMGQRVFTIGVENNVLRLWPGEGIDIKPVLDPKFRQAVLKIDEGARSFEVTGTAHVTHSVNHKHFNPTLGRYVHPHMEETAPTSRQRGRRKAICDPAKCPSCATAVRRDVRTRQSLPKTATIVIDKMAWSSRMQGTLRYTATVTAAPSSTSFLVGIDESSHFVSQLPGHPSNVRAARESLRPTAVPKGAKRQGEWFFTPCTEKEIAVINAELVNPKFKTGGRHRWDRRRERVNPEFTVIEPSSSHRVTGGIRLNGERYAIGMVYDTREGRHAPLILENWHKIVRNTEVVQAVPRARSNRSSGPRWD